MAALPAPSACRWCGIDRRPHFQQWTRDAGWHTWTPPTQQQIKERMLARRHARLTAPAPAYHATTHWTGSAASPDDEGDAICADCLAHGCAQYLRIQDRRLRAQYRAWGVRIRWGRRATAGGWGADPSSQTTEPNPF